MSANRIPFQLGKLIQNGRKAARWTQKELAERTGLGEATIARMEAGSNSRILDLLKVVHLVSPNSIPRILEAVTFKPEDFTHSPLDALRLANSVKTTQRVRPKTAGKT